MVYYMEWCLKIKFSNFMYILICLKKIKILVCIHFYFWKSCQIESIVILFKYELRNLSVNI